MARAATARDDAGSSNLATEDRFDLYSIQVVLPAAREVLEGLAPFRRDVDAKALAIVRNAVRQEAAQGIARCGAETTLVYAAHCALQHAFHFTCGSEGSNENAWVLYTDKSPFPQIPRWSVANWVAWNVAILAQWLVEARAVGEARGFRMETIVAADSVTTFAGRGGFAHDVALEFADSVLDEIMLALIQQDAVRCDADLVADMNVAEWCRKDVHGAPEMSEFGDILARLFNKATTPFLRLRRPDSGFPSREELEMLDARLVATMAALRTRQRSAFEGGLSPVLGGARQSGEDTGGRGLQTLQDESKSQSQQAIPELERIVREQVATPEAWVRADDASRLSHLDADTIRKRSDRDGWTTKKSGKMNCYRLADLERTWPNRRFRPDNGDK